MNRILAAVAAVAVGATAVYAQNTDVIKQRREAMRTIAGGTGAVLKITKGEAPFDLATVQKALATVQTEAAKFKTLFPDDAKTGGGTDAQPKIWSDRAGFNAAIDGWIGKAKTAADAIKDEATFKTEYPKFGGGCGACHKATDGYAISVADSFKKPRP